MRKIDEGIVATEDHMSDFCRWCAVACLAASTLASCSTAERIAAVPNEHYLDATIPGMPGVRYFADGELDAIVEDGLESVRRERSHLEANGHKGPLPPAIFMAISGGGDNGAFAAGLLNGWSVHESRPDFKVVTGISTGALIAPFAFLGADYDDRLREVYTTIEPDDVYRPRSIFEFLTSDAASDNAPLWKLIKLHAGVDMLDAIAAESKKGRLLLVGTTNLDAQRPVIWNIGKIAESNHPDRVRLFQSILIASAAIPGAFPPIMIDVEANGQRYQEMHVDGGTVAQVFVYPPSLDLKKLSEKKGIIRERRLYVIRNARLDPDWASVERSIFDIAGRAIQTLIQNQGIGDLYKIYLTARRDGIEYNFAHIPSNFEFEHTEEFDTAYMNALFDLAYQTAIKGYPWQKAPPGFEALE